MSPSRQGGGEESRVLFGEHLVVNRDFYSSPKFGRKRPAIAPPKLMGRGIHGLAGAALASRQSARRPQRSQPQPPRGEEVVIRKKRVPAAM